MTGQLGLTKPSLTSFEKVVPARRQAISLHDYLRDQATGVRRRHCSRSLIFSSASESHSIRQLPGRSSDPSSAEPSHKDPKQPHLKSMTRCRGNDQSEVQRLRFAATAAFAATGPAGWWKAGLVTRDLVQFSERRSSLGYLWNCGFGLTSKLLDLQELVKDSHVGSLDDPLRRNTAFAVVLNVRRQ